MDQAPIEEMELLQNLIVEIRALRKEIGVEEKTMVPIEVRTHATAREVFRANHDIIEKLARVSEVRLVDGISAGLSTHHATTFDLGIVYERKVDVTAQRERLMKEIEKREKQHAADERQLNDPVFLRNAPVHIVEGKRKLTAENLALLEKARAALKALPEG